MKKNRGMSVIEIVIGAAIISVGILALTTTYNTYVQYTFANEKNVQANYILQEGVEAVTLLRDRGWSNIAGLSQDTPHYLAWSGSNWAIGSNPEYIDGQFLREFVVTGVNRDAGGRVSTIGTDDPNTKQITVTVSYFQGHATTTRSVPTYITNLYGN